MRQVSKRGALAGAAVIFCISGPSFAAGLTGTLSQLVARWETSDPTLSPLLALHLTSRSGDPVALVRLADDASSAQVMSELSAVGFRLTAVSTIDARLVEGYLPLGSARAAANVPGVRFVRAQLRPKSNAGSVQSQAVALEKADRVQQQGIDGRGTRIGALSDSFDACTSCSTHAAQDVASGDLSPVTVLQELDPANGPGSDEGRAMLQLIHDIAPGAGSQPLHRFRTGERLQGSAGRSPLAAAATPAVAGYSPARAMRWVPSGFDFLGRASRW
jgi:hypothetical protein